MLLSVVCAQITFIIEFPGSKRFIMKSVLTFGDEGSLVITDSQKILIFITGQGRFM